MYYKLESRCNVFIHANDFGSIYPLECTLVLLLGSEDSADTSPNELRALSSINRLPNSSLFVVVDNGSSLGMVGAQSLFEGFGIIVRTLDKGFSGLVICHGFLGWVDWCDVSYVTYRRNGRRRTFSVVRPS